MSKFKLFVVLAAAVALMAVPAFAEVQNIKVSGDLALRNVNRSGFGVETFSGAGFAGTGQRGSEDFQMLQATVNVDADLTDNVSACVGLASDGIWGVTPGATNFDVGVYRAYIVLKEFFYEPLTVTVGRQPLWFGKGFIVGSNILNWDPEGNLTQPLSSGLEYSNYTNFDAIRVTLDYSPWTIDGFYSKLDDGVTTDLSDDVQLYGSNIGYKFAEYNAEAEGYYVGLNASDMNMWFVNTREPVQVHTFGARGSFDPIANITLWGEGAYQFGKMQNQMNNNHRTISAWACDIGGEYRFSDYAWLPKLGGEFIYYSGERNPNATTGKWKGWFNITKGKFDTAIREYVGNVYPEIDPYDQGGFTNEMQFAAYGGVQPLDTLSVDARYTHFRLARKYVSNYTVDSMGQNYSRSAWLGDEIDVMATYDYTEDVQFSLLGALFIPGDYFDDADGGAATPKQESNVTSIVSSVKVAF